MKPFVPVMLFVVCIFCFLAKAEAQYYFYDNNYYDSPIVFEVGASIGAMNCFTDLGGRKGVGKKFTKDLTLSNTQLCGSGYLSAIYKNAIAVRAETTYGQVSANDNILKKYAASTFGRYERNLSFRSYIFELMLLSEIHPLMILQKFDDDKTPPRTSPYLLAGIGYFAFNPQAKLNNTWVFLRPMHTEGEGFSEYPDRPNYKLRQINIPDGAGIKYELSSLLNLRIECVYRILKTDYLDDVSQVQYVDPSVFSKYFSDARLANALALYDRRKELNPNGDFSNEQRGNPKHNDAYFSFNFKLGLMFSRPRIKGSVSR